MKKYLLTLLILCCAFLFIGCSDDKVDDSVKSISIDETTIPNYVLIQKFDEQITNIKINVLKANGQTESISLSKDMITSDLSHINELGKQKLTISYEKCETELTLNVKNYEAKVVYPDGTTAAKGVQVQWCDSKMCYTPVITNDLGLSAIDLDNGEYYVHLEKIPEGYTYDPNVYITTSENYSLTIKLLKLENYTSGEGTTESPYVVGCGTYTSEYLEQGKNGALYFSFTPEEAGTYNITSISMDALATKKVDPYIGFLGTDVNNITNADVSGNVKDNINFDYTFSCEANTTYYFMLFVSSVDTTSEPFPATFEFVITKK